MNLDQFTFHFQAIDREQGLKANEDLTNILGEDLNTMWRAQLEGRKISVRREREKTAVILNLGIPLPQTIANLDQKPGKESAQEVLTAWAVRGTLITLLKDLESEKDVTGIWVLRAESPQDPWAASIFGHEKEDSSQIVTGTANINLNFPGVGQKLFETAEEKLMGRGASNVYVSSDFARHGDEYSYKIIQFLQHLGYTEVAYRSEHTSFLRKARPIKEN